MKEIKDLMQALKNKEDTLNIELTITKNTIKDLQVVCNHDWKIIDEFKNGHNGTMEGEKQCNYCWARKYF